MSDGPSRYTPRLTPADAGTKPDRIKLDPATTTFGQAVHLLRWGNGGFYAVALELSGCRELERYANAVLGKTLPDAIDDIRKLVARRRNISFLEVDMMPLADAVRILLEPEAAGIEAPAPPSGSVTPFAPEGSKPAAPASGTEAAGIEAPRLAGKKVPRGKLDEYAAIELERNPSLTDAQLAVMLGCSPKTLRDQRKTPMLAAAKKRRKAKRREFEHGDEWSD